MTATALPARQTASMSSRSTGVAELFGDPQFPHCTAIDECPTFEAELPLLDQSADNRTREPRATTEPPCDPLLFGGGLEAKWRPAHVDEIKTGRIDPAFFQRQPHVPI